MNDNLGASPIPDLEYLEDYDISIPYFPLDLSQIPTYKFEDIKPTASLGKYKLGSLFDGSGGFPLAGSLCGIVPMWASEVEPYPIAVTRSRFPHMKHLGDISKINGAEIEPVDVITFGSPCQDLSVAGKRAGLKHEDNGDEETTRSGLFMEAVRIIKEMRNATDGKYPTFALWENVPGAFSSNKGEDFRIVLEELIKIVEPTASVPPAPKNGWPYADCYMGDGWSLAYRVFDAQYWGVPQRRRRIHLVADFRGQCAGEILFKREGLRGYFTESGTQGQGTAADVGGSLKADDREGTGNCLTPWDVQSRRVFSVDGPWPALYGGEGGGHGYACIEQYLFENHSQDTRYKGPLEVSPMLPAQLGTGGNNQPFVVEKTVYESHPQDARVKELGEVGPTVTSKYHKGTADTPLVVEQSVFRKGTRPHSAEEAQKWEPAEVANTLNTFDQGEARANELVVEGVPVYCLQGNGIDRADTAGCNDKGVKEDICYTLNTIDRPAVAYAMQAIGEYKESDVASSMKSRDYKDATDLVVEENPIVLDRAFYNQGVNAQYDPQIYEDGTCPTLVARGPSAVCVRYIVRRLTPTECARLQGFADRWGHIDPKEDFTEEEYRFWLEVRNTHAAINGKAVKEYPKAQMLTWYNKLQTDSSMYKLWGSGIALPPALYCMQGIAEALEGCSDG